MARTRLKNVTNQARNQHEKSFNSSVLGSKLGMQNGSNQGTIKELMLHKWQATPCARPTVVVKRRFQDLLQDPHKSGTRFKTNVNLDFQKIQKFPNHRLADFPEKNTKSLQVGVVKSSQNPEKIQKNQFYKIEERIKSRLPKANTSKLILFLE